MKLTDAERVILRNQYLILEALYPEEKEYYSSRREAIECGYEAFYRAEGVETDPESVMSASESEEVIAILEMFRVINQSLSELGHRDEAPHGLKFDGFDGNNETKQLAFARWFCTQPGGRFTETVDPKNLNSHSQRLEKYRARLHLYEGMKAKRRASSRSPNDYLLTQVELDELNKAAW